MCGIIGFIKNDCLLNIYNGLLLLEYRGYDSVGIAFNIGNKTKVIKKKGRVSELRPLIEGYTSNIGIGHTRWATQGRPTTVNAHPHKCKHFTIIHNGIIENSEELKTTLTAKNYNFLSQTDSEVIAVLLEEYYNPNNILQGIKSALDMLTGSYALAILCEHEPESIFLAKKDNPLIIGKGEDFYCFASDTPAIVGFTQNIYKMKDGEIAILNKNSIELYDKELHEKDIVFNKTYLTVDNIDKGNYPTYMLKEICETPLACENTLRYLSTLNFPTESINLEKFNSLVIIGCGTAYHAGLYAKELAVNLLGIDARCITSSEFLIDKSHLDEKTLVIALSQSGETADTIYGIKKAKEKGAYIIALTNVPFSTVTTLSDFCLTTRAGAEIAVAATKSYSTQLVALQYIINKLKEGTTPLETHKLSKDINNVLKYKNFLFDFVNNNSFDNFFFIGKGSDYQTALEGALKVKEIAYCYCDATPSGEIKHGPLAMVDKRTLVVCIISREEYLKSNINAINEILTRGATVLTISPFKICECLPETKVCQCEKKKERLKNQKTSNSLNYENKNIISLQTKKLPVIEVTIPKCEENNRALLSIIPIQLLAYNLSIKKGLDPDKPRNLAKSVTVH